jgi:crossover junction endodeoxyribonuclease RusA
MTGRVWRLDFPYTRPLTLNARQHWSAKQRAVRHWRQTAKFLALQAKIPPLERVAVELHYCPRDSRRRDPLNLVATLKPIEDGIVDAGVIPDDTPRWSEPTMPMLDPADSTATVQLYVLVRELAPVPA